MSATKRGTGCKALTKSGNPCRAAATDTGLCYFHSNPNKVAELGRIGGKRNRRLGTWTTDTWSPMDSARSAVDELNRIYDRVSTGAITPKVGHTLVQVINAKERINQKVVLERKIAELQNDLTTLKSIIRSRNIDLETSKAEETEELEP
jgi:Family of unknown function (DUF5763)